MTLKLIDWLIIGVFFIISLGIGIIMSKKAGKSTRDFFLSGRNLPWYIAGTSMVATTFAADTPLAVTELVAKNGIAGNWLWWNMVFGGMLTVFFFARLWRRAEILTDAEFVSIRYAGKASDFLRGFRAVYIGIFMNMIVISWINLAMAKIIKVMFPEISFFGIKEIELMGFHFSSYLLIVGCIMIFTAFYSSLSGLAGVSIADTFQFFIAMTGCVILAIFALHHIGGIDVLKTKLSSTKWVFNFLPEFGENSGAVGTTKSLLKMSTMAMITYFGVQWWAQLVSWCRTRRRWLYCATNDVCNFEEIHEDPGYFKKESLQAQEMNFGQLDRYIRDLRQSGFDTMRLRVELWHKLAYPLVPSSWRRWPFLSRSPWAAAARSPA